MRIGQQNDQRGSVSLATRSVPVHSEDFPKGVFPYLLDVAAFLDRVALAVSGTLRRRPLPSLVCGSNIAIGGIGRPYARAIHGICLKTGNPFEIRYGANHLFKNLAPVSLRFRSEGCPLTQAEVASVAAALLRSGYKAQPSLLEYTVDLTGASVADLANSMVTRLRSATQLQDELGRITQYAGTPNSAVQIRVYNKAVTRVELVLRSEFLRSHGILSIADIEKLRTFDFSNLMRFCAQKANGHLKSELAHVPAGCVRRNLLTWPGHWPLNLWVRALRSWGVNAERHLLDTAVQTRVDSMQRRLIW